MDRLKRLWRSRAALPRKKPFKNREGKALLALSKTFRRSTMLLQP